MNHFSIGLGSVKAFVLAWAATAVFSAHALSGVLEIRGVLISPGCQLSLVALQRVADMAQVSGHDCGLTRQADNAMSNAMIAQMSQETIGSPTSAAPPKRVLTLSYR